MGKRVGGMVMDPTAERNCIICGLTKKTQEGIILISEIICESCESEMVRTDVKDEKYPFFIDRMKRIWYNQHNVQG